MSCLYGVIDYILSVWGFGNFKPKSFLDDVRKMYYKEW